MICESIGGRPHTRPWDILLYIPELGYRNDYGSGGNDYCSQSVYLSNVSEENESYVVVAIVVD